MSQFWGSVFKTRDRSGRGRLGGRRGAVALEFAIIALPFFAWLLFLFELSYDLFTQEALDYALNSAVRQIQTGGATSLTSGAAFITSDLCPATKGLLECGNMWIRVTAVTAPDYTPPTTTGSLPVSKGGLDLSQYTNSLNANTSTPNANPYCIAQASQPILVSVIYLGPSFIGGLIPGVLSTSFGGTTVHATLATAGFVTEPYGNPPPAKGGGSGATPAPSCGT